MKINTVDNNVGIALFNQNAAEGTAIVRLQLELTDAASIELPKGWTATHESTSDLGNEIWGFGPPKP